MRKQQDAEVISNDQTRPVRGAQRKKPASVEQELANVSVKPKQRHAPETTKQHAGRTEPDPITAGEDCAAVCRSTLDALERFAKDVEALTVDDAGARRISTFPAAARLNASYQNAVYAKRLLGERLVEVYGKRERFKDGPTVETATMKYGKGGAPLILGSATQALTAPPSHGPARCRGRRRKTGARLWRRDSSSGTGSRRPSGSRSRRESRPSGCTLRRRMAPDLALRRRFRGSRMPTTSRGSRSGRNATTSARDIRRRRSKNCSRSGARAVTELGSAKITSDNELTREPRSSVFG
jgi:hypothetical protein